MAESVKPRKGRRLITGTVVVAVAAGTIALGAATAQATSICTTLDDGDQGSAQACYSYVATGGGYYNGSYSIGVTTGYTYVQIYKDGAITSVAGSGSYTHVKKFYMRACSDFGTCGAWW